MNVVSSDGTQTQAETISELINEISDRKSANYRIGLCLNFMFVLLSWKEWNLSPRFGFIVQKGGLLAHFFLNTTELKKLLPPQVGFG